MVSVSQLLICCIQKLSYWHMKIGELYTYFVQSEIITNVTVFLRWWYTKHKQMVVLIWNMIYLIDAKVIILRPKIFIWMIIYTIMRYQMLKDYTNYYYEIIKRINQFCWMNPCVRPFKLITNSRGILDDPVYLIIMRQIRRL